MATPALSSRVQSAVAEYGTMPSFRQLARSNPRKGALHQSDSITGFGTQLALLDFTGRVGQLLTG